MSTCSVRLRPCSTYRCYVRTVMKNKAKRKTRLRLFEGTFFILLLVNVRLTVDYLLFFCAFLSAPMRLIEQPSRQPFSYCHSYFFCIFKFYAISFPLINFVHIHASCKNCPVLKAFFFKFFLFPCLCFANDHLAGIPLPVVIVWAVVKANWFTYTSTEGHVSPFTFVFLPFVVYILPYLPKSLLHNAW